MTSKPCVPLENVNSETSLNTSCIVSLFNPIELLGSISSHMLPSTRKESFSLRMEKNTKKAWSNPVSINEVYYETPITRNGQCTTPTSWIFATQKCLKWQTVNWNWYLVYIVNSKNCDQSGIIARNRPWVLLVAFSDEVVKMKLLVLLLDSYLFSMMSGDRYLPRSSKKILFSVTFTGNETVSRWVVPVLAIHTPFGMCNGFSGIPSGKLPLRNIVNAR